MSNKEQIEIIDKLILSIDNDLAIDNFDIIDNLLKSNKFTNDELDHISVKIKLLIKNMEVKKEEMQIQQIELVENSYAYKKYFSKSLT